MVLMMMRFTESLDLICLKGFGPRTSGKLDLPSWAPNLVYLWAGSLTIQERNFFEWKSVNSFMPVLHGSSTGILKVLGKFLGKITSLSTGINPEGIIHLPSHRCAPWIHGTSGLPRENRKLWNASDKDRDVRDATYRTLTMCLLPETIS